MKRTLLGIAISAFAITGVADPAIHYSNGELTIATEDQTIILSCAGEHTINVIADSNQPSYSLANRPCSAEFKNGETPEFKVGDLSAHINPHNGHLSYSFAGKPLFEEHQGLSESENKFSFQVDSEEVLYGAGERVLGMNRRGNHLPLYNRAHYGYGTHSEQMYYSMPMVISSDKYAVVYDNPANGSLNLAKDSNIVEFSAVGGRHAYWVTAADTWLELNQHIADATGYQPLPPRWALGSFASRFGYRTQKEVLQTAALYREQNIPLDAIVIDLYWFGKDIQGHMGNLRWDSDAFPSPREMIKELSDHDVQTVLITEPFILTSSSRWEDAVAAQALATNADGTPGRYDFYFGNTGLVDVFSPQGQQWFSDIYDELADYGVAGWWGDLGEPEVHPADLVHSAGRADEIHNAYGHQWAELVQQSAHQRQSNQRPFIMMRSGFVGSQRFGMIPWSGDVSRSWDGLAAQPEIMLQMGMQGMAYMHSDLGGFTPAEVLDAELYERWLQFGAFTPVFRPHAEESIASEPVYHPEDTAAIARRALRERYSMMPYTYTLAHENANTGAPFARPMFFYHDDSKWLEVSDQYYWGDRLIVAPVLSQGMTERTIMLPIGGWYDLYSHEYFSGDQTIRTQLEREHIPVFIQAGRAMLRADDLKSLSTYDISALTVDYFASHGDSNDELLALFDDGLSIQQDTSAITIKSIENDQSITFNIVASGPELSVETLTLNIVGLATAPSSLLVNQEHVKFTFDQKTNRTSIELSFSTNINIEVIY